MMLKWKLASIACLLPKIYTKSRCHFVSSAFSNNNAVADVHLIPMFNDNYGFIIVDRATGFAACIDPGDGEVICQAVQKNNFQLNSVFCTHKHGDHIGGNGIVKQKFPNVEIIGPKYEIIPHITTKVEENIAFQFGSLNVRVLHVPCHTKGHIAYYITQATPQESPLLHNKSQQTGLSPILFCGDTLFVGGCGRFFEGTAQDMLRNMDRFTQLPHNTLVYCAHEYTESNLKFLSHIDPENCLERYMSIQKVRREGVPTVPTTIREELMYNLFMKCREERTQKLVGADNAVEAMSKLREMKNKFK